MKLSARTSFFAMLVFIQIFSLPVAGAPSPAPTSAPAAQGRPAAARLIRSDASGVLFEVDVPAPTVADVRVAGQTYQALALPGFTPLAQPGRPALPAAGWLIGTPPGAVASLQVTALDVTRLTNVHVPPAVREGRAPLDPTQNGLSTIPERTY